MTGPLKHDTPEQGDLRNDAREAQARRAAALARLMDRLGAMAGDEPPPDPLPPRPNGKHGP